MNIGKQVRFTAEEEPLLKQQADDVTALGGGGAAKGYVSKRGRYVSPGRRNGSNPSPAAAPAATAAVPPPPPSADIHHSSFSSVVEYKTYRSPDNSIVPSLCSAPSHEDTKQEAAKGDDFMVRSSYPSY